MAAVDPERRRMMAELAAWHSEWAQKWGIDDHPYDGDTIEEWESRIPPEAEADYQRRADEIMGIDPATGLRPRSQPLPAAGTDDWGPHQLPPPPPLPSSGSPTGPGRDHPPAGQPPTGAAHPATVGQPPTGAAHPAAVEQPPTGAARAVAGAPLPAARTREEAFFYMSLQPCPHCGQLQTRWTAELVMVDEVMLRRYCADCPGCGRPREFTFALPEHIAERPEGARVHYGGDDPSRLVDAGQWLAMSESMAGEARTDLARGDLANAGLHAEVATTFVREAVKFIPQRETAVPGSAFWSSLGRQLYTADPARFTLRRLVMLLDMLHEEFDPQTGRAAPSQPAQPAHPVVPAPERLGRTNAEMRLYLDLLPCVCGETSAPWSSRVLSQGGELVAEYQAACPRCGRARSVVFRLPAQHIASGPEGANFRYGAEQPSQLLDAGEWLTVADELSRSVAMLPAGAAEQERQRFRYALGRAAAALAEVAKFAPAGAAQVPESALFTDRGRAVYHAEPGRFRLDRLTAVRATYLRLLAEAGLD